MLSFLRCFTLVVLLAIAHFSSFAQCSAKIGLEPGSFATGCGYPHAIHLNSKASIGVKDLQWNFGDGTTSFANNPVHEFFYDSIQKKDALYKVVLTVNCMNGSVSKDSMVVTALKVPFVKFTADTNIACQLGDPVCFTNLSENNPNYSYLWNFDLGETSTQFAPCHKFSLSGYKRPRLTVTTDNNCAREYTLADTVEVVAIPNPSFVVSPQTGCNPMTVSVTNNTNPSQVGKIRWMWGDGLVDSVMHPGAHTYYQAGVFNLKLLVINPIGCENSSELVINNQPTPSAKISVSDEIICLEKSVQIVQDTVTYPGAEYIWNFDKPSQLLGSDKGPYTVTWDEPGLKQVSLHINLNGCTTSISRIVFVNPFSMLHLEQTSVSANTCENEELQFIATPSYYSKYYFLVNGDTVQSSSSNVLKSSLLKKNDIVHVAAVDRMNCPTYTLTPPQSLNLKSLPIVTLQSSPTGSTICEGDTLVLSATPSGYDDYRFFDGNILLQKESSVLVFDYTQATGNPIRVLAYDDGCQSDTSLVASYVIPQIEQSLARPIINCGQSTIGSIQFVWDSIPGALGYEISLNGNVYEAANGSFSHQIFLAADSVVYAHVRAKGAMPCGDGLPSIDSASCKSIPCTPVSFTKSNDLEMCKGQSAYISIKDISIPNFDIFWNKSSIPTANRLRLIQPEQSGRYYVSVKNTDEPDCPLVSKFIDVVVHEIPEVTLSASVMADSICEQTPIEFRAVSSEYDSYEFYSNWDLVQKSTSPIYKVSDIKDQHQFRVRAIHNSCRSELSNPISYRVFKQLGQTQVVCGTTSVNSVNFLWDDVPGALGYMVSIDSLGGIPSFADVGKVLEYSIDGLALGESRTITVKPYGIAPCVECLEYASATCFTENCDPLTFEKSKDLEICEGDTVELSISQVSVPYYSVSWNTLPYAKDTVKQFVFTKDTILMVSVRNNLQLQCNASKKYFKIKVHPYPQATIQVADYQDSVCAGTAVTFIATPSGYDEYYFYDNWKLVQKSSSPIYVSPQYLNQHIIHVKPKDNGCLNQEGASVQREVIEPLDPPQVNCGKTTTGSVEFVWDSIPGALGYEISVNDNSFIPSNGKFSHTVFTTPATQVYVEVIAFGDTPCGTSLSSTIWSGNLAMCETKPCEPIDFTRPLNTTLCTGESLQLEITNITEPLNYSVSWNNQAETTALTYMYTPTKTDTVSIAYTDKNQLGCAPAVKYVVVKVNFVPVTTLTASSNTVCQYSSLSIEALEQGLDSYRFFSNAGLLYAGNNYAYTLHNIEQDTSVYVTINHQGCEYSTSPFEITTIQLPNIEISSSQPDGTVCENSLLQFSIQADASYNSFAFYRKSALLQESINPNYIISRIYLADSLRIDTVHAYAYNSFGCRSKASNSVKHSILPKTNVLLSADLDTICLYQNVSLATLPNNLVSYTYLLNNQELIVDAEAEHIHRVTNLQSNLQVLAINADGCVSDTSNTIALVVKPVANPVIVASDTVICIGESVSLQALIEDGYSNVQYFWSTGATEKTTNLTPTNTSQVFVYTLYDACTSLSDSLEVIVDLVKPVIDSVMPITACIGSDIELQANGGVNYRWYPADALSDSYVQNPMLTVLETQLYTFVVSNLACVDSSKVLVMMDLCLKELPEEIPQIITPNGDGINDIWKITHVDYFKENTLKIFNRWGMSVYEASPYENTWQGQTSKNKDLPNGTYFYKLDLGPGLQSYSGYVIINR